MISNIKNKEEIIKLFPKNGASIEILANKYITQAQEKINKIINIPSKEKTFENTYKAFDQLCSLDNISILFNTLMTLEMLSPNKEIREAAHNEIIKIQNFWVENISNNLKIYKALKDYFDNNSKKEELTKEQQYFITETITDYKRSGLDLPVDKLKKVKKLNKELGELTLQFETNIAQDKKTVLLKENELKNVDPEFINNLKKDETGSFVLPLDYPTYFTIMDNCSIESTRKKLYLAFNNRAYPVNKELLEKIIEKRHELAKLLGFKSYAHLDLDDQMAKTPETVTKFLTSLYQRAENKTQEEFKQITEKLPESVTLTKNNKIKPWDTRYLKNYYKKNNFKLDEEEISQYFPTTKTVKKLLEIYEQFFNLKFNLTNIPGLWHNDIQLIEVYSQKNLNQLLGYLLLDLYPRDNKYSHACQQTIIPAAKGHGPCLCIVVANFPKVTDKKPALMQKDDVETFFHELGHALHSILGRTDIASFSGTSVKTDFVEMPSQMLEEWLFDKDILKSISSHYKTNKPLSNELIHKIIKFKNFDIGDFLQRQCYLSCLALAYFSNNKIKNTKEIYQTLNKEMRKNIEYNQDDNMYASFGHLSGYGAKYYSYMWSKVFALDMFDKIKKHGLLNPIIGQQYIDLVVGKGGSQDPNLLLKNFLEREPNSNAFFDNLGFKSKK